MMISLGDSVVKSHKGTPSFSPPRANEVARAATVSLPLFLQLDWAKLYRDKSHGTDALVDYDALSPDDKRFLKQLQETLDRIPTHERELMEKKVEQFLNGEISWAEFDCYPPELLYRIAKMGYSYVELNRLKEADTIFKGLSILDHKNYYYRGMLGVIAQKRKDYVDAITEYSLAVELNPTDIPSYTNRGECWLQAGVLGKAIGDFEKAMELGKTTADKWVNRARILHKNTTEKLQGISPSPLPSPAPVRRSPKGEGGRGEGEKR